MLPRSKTFRIQTPELLARVKALRAAGKTYREMSEETGVSQGTLNRWCEPSVDENTKRCRADYQRRHPEKTKAYNKKSRGTLDSKVSQALANIARNAAQDGYKPCLTKKAIIIAAYESQCGECALCGSLAGKLCVDHCHETGLFRGWLCVRCNRVLGLLGDNPVLTDRATKYLHRVLDVEDAAC